DNKFVYVLMGDGELQEGQIWEAALFAAHYKLSNLIAFVDVNGQQIDGPTQKVINLGNLEAKFNAFGWRTMHMDGHDYDRILATIQQAQNPHQDNLPTIILMKTIMGKGVSFMEGTHEWHGVAPNDQQLSIALNELQKTLGDYKN
ncbi:MAG: transketolase, partial [Sediminibacterium sp.]|nr:transketolase [Sediminibacterium sp.]